MRKPSPATLKLLRALAVQPDARRYGYELMQMTGLASGTLYPILMRLSDNGLLVSEWERLEHNGRPPRHLYRLSAGGLAFTRSYAAEQPGLAQLRPQAGTSA